MTAGANGAPAGWPLFGLRVSTPRLVLRVPSEGELLTLAERAAGRVLPAEERTFMGPWTQLPSPEFERSFMQFHWGTRASWTADAWLLELGVYPHGELEATGMVGLHGTHFPRQRSMITGSWLLPEWRGRRLGVEARAAALHLAFTGLGAREARSSAHPDNAPSHAVSRSLGYRPDGTEPFPAGGEEAVTMTRLLLTREQWLTQRREDITITGLDDCRELFGLRQPGGDDAGG